MTHPVPEYRTEFRVETIVTEENLGEKDGNYQLMLSVSVANVVRHLISAVFLTPGAEIEIPGNHLYRRRGIHPDGILVAYDILTAPGSDDYNTCESMFVGLYSYTKPVDSFETELTEVVRKACEPHKPPPD